jgi:serine/threonine-protein kinase
MGNVTLERTMVEQLLPAYEIEGELGRGAWGIVYGARHRHLDRQVAVKQLPRAFGADPDAKRRFVTEARLLAALDHPHIVPVYDYAEDGGLCLLVMERLSGGTLWARWSAQGLDERTAVATILAVLAGLHHAHLAGVLHRDIKPENILYATSGRPKLADFGIAKVLGAGDANATRVGDVLGTPAYIAPEQAQGLPLGPGTDVYATAVVLYELLAGRLPFSEEGDAMALLWRHVYEPPSPLTDAAPTLPAVIAEVVMHALAKAPADRPATAEEFAVALASAATSAWGNGWQEATQVPVDLPSAVQQALLRSTSMPPPAPTSSGTSSLPPPAAPRSAPTVMVGAAPLSPPPSALPAPTPSLTLRNDQLASHAAALARAGNRPHLAEVLDGVADTAHAPHITVVLGGNRHSGTDTLATAIGGRDPATPRMEWVPLGQCSTTVQNAVLRGCAQGVDGVMVALRAGRSLRPEVTTTLATLAQSRVPSILCVTKADRYPSALTQQLLLATVRELPGIRLHAVSAELALDDPTDTDLRRESGLTQLQASLDRELVRPRTTQAVLDGATWVAGAAHHLLHSAATDAAAVDEALRPGSVRDTTMQEIERLIADARGDIDSELHQAVGRLQRATNEPEWDSAATTIVQTLAARAGALLADTARLLGRTEADIVTRWTALATDTALPAADSYDTLGTGHRALLARQVLPVLAQQLDALAGNLDQPWALPGPGLTDTAAARDARQLEGRRRGADAAARMPDLAQALALAVGDSLRHAARTSIDRLVHTCELLADDLRSGATVDPTATQQYRSLLEAAQAVMAA